MAAKSIQAQSSLDPSPTIEYAENYRFETLPQLDSEQVGCLMLNMGTSPEHISDLTITLDDKKTYVNGQYDTFANHIRLFVRPNQDLEKLSAVLVHELRHHKDRRDGGKAFFVKEVSVSLAAMISSVLLYKYGIDTISDMVIETSSGTAGSTVEQSNSSLKDVGQVAVTYVGGLMLGRVVGYWLSPTERNARRSQRNKALLQNISGKLFNPI